MKVPPPHRPIDLTRATITAWSAPLWRVFRIEGDHATVWNGFREFGPLPGMRFDPHPAGSPQRHPGFGVIYTAEDHITSLAEVFSRTRIIDRGRPGDRRAIAAWEPARGLELLDVTARTVTAVFGAAAVQMMEDKSRTQEWANALVQDHGGTIDGILYRSSVDNGHAITLFNRARTSVPTQPAEYQELSGARATIYIEDAAEQLGFGVA